MNPDSRVLVPALPKMLHRPLSVSPYDPRGQCGGFHQRPEAPADRAQFHWQGAAKASSQ